MAAEIAAGVHSTSFNAVANAEQRGALQLAIIDSQGDAAVGARGVEIRMRRERRGRGEASHLAWDGCERDRGG